MEKKKRITPRPKPSAHSIFAEACQILDAMDDSRELRNGSQVHWHECKSVKHAKALVELIEHAYENVLEREHKRSFRNDELGRYCIVNDRKSWMFFFNLPELVLNLPAQEIKLEIRRLQREMIERLQRSRFVTKPAAGEGDTVVYYRLPPSGEDDDLKARLYADILSAHGSKTTSGSFKETHILPADHDLLLALETPPKAVSQARA